MKIQLLLVGLFFSTVALASDDSLLHIGTTPDDEEMFLDIDSIRNASDRVLGGLRNEYYSIEVTAKHSDSTISKINNIVSCKDKSYYISGFIMYDSSGRVIDSSYRNKIISPYDFDYTFSGSISRIMVDATCYAVELGLHKK